MSIGVSNFDLPLLEELLQFATVIPHVVQNFAEPGNLDNDVRAWCKENDVIYQPYASIRNLNALPSEVSKSLHRIAKAKSVSPHSVALNLFIQTGASVIPRSKDIIHLKENLEAFQYELNDGEMIELGWYHDIHNEL